MTVISFLIIRFYQGYRLFNSYTFPDEPIREIEIYSIGYDDEKVNRLNYIIDDDEFIQQFFEEIGGLVLKDKLYHKGTKYPRYQLVIRFEDAEVEEMMVLIQKDGIIEVFGDHALVRYRGKLTRDNRDKFLLLVDKFK